MENPNIYPFLEEVIEISLKRKKQFHDLKAALQKGESEKVIHIAEILTGLKDEFIDSAEKSS